MGIANNCFTACMIANLHRFKDHVTLLQAWRQVVEQLEKTGRSSLLLLAGRFDDSYKSLKSLTSDLELGESVRFLGPVSDVSGLLSAVDLGVFSSRLEGCPNGVLECMSAGLAIAATDIAGIREAVEPGGYEFLAPPGDAEALADCILKLALNPELRTELGARNLDHIRNVFNPERMCEEMSALISDCLRARSENSYPPFSSLQTCT
jgi:glycosyltransferase involved in cell wall biosynthesis